MIVGRGGGVVMLYVLFFFSFSFFFWGDLISVSLRGGGGGGGGNFAPRGFFPLALPLVLMNSRMNRSRAARTDVMFRNLLPKEVFTKTFLFVHDEECLPTCR